MSSSFISASGYSEDKYIDGDNEITFAIRFGLDESLVRSGESEDGFRSDYYVSHSPYYDPKHENDIYCYNGKRIHSGRFTGFLDKEHKFIVFEDGIFKEGKKILDNKSSKLTLLGDNFFVTQIAGGIKIYAPDGKKLKTFAGQYLGFNPEHKKIAVLKDNNLTSPEVVTYDYSDINNIHISKNEENRLINYKRDRYIADFHGFYASEKQGHINQTVSFNPLENVKDVLYTKNGKAVLLNQTGADDKLHWSNEVMNALTENMELFDKDMFQQLYKDLARFSCPEMADKIQKNIRLLTGKI